MLLGIEWFPERASREATGIDNLFWFLTWSCAVIFTIVTTALVYSIWRFRAQPGDDSDGAPIHGHTGLEIVWTVIPVLLLIVVMVWAWIVLEDTEKTTADRLVVPTVAQQFAWTFQYPEIGAQSGDLRVPLGRQVELELRAPDTDVIHSFFVPEFRVKKDVVPGIVTRVWFTPTKVGTYPVVCTELCGVGHNAMRSRVVVMPQAEYDQWLRTTRAKLAA
ncbi:MAG: cytochrome c oxidase subunit II [Actinomycetota bacterium]